VGNLSSGPVHAIVLEGPNAVDTWKKIVDPSGGSSGSGGGGSPSLYASPDADSATCDLDFFFPEKVWRGQTWIFHHVRFVSLCLLWCQHSNASNELLLSLHDVCQPQSMPTEFFLEQAVFIRRVPTQFLVSIELVMRTLFHNDNTVPR
jgi:hypothetical protein